MMLMKTLRIIMILLMEIDDINDEEVVGHNEHDDIGPDVLHIQVDEIDDDEGNCLGDNNEPLEERHLQNDEPTENDLNTDEEEELQEGPPSALSQGIQKTFRINVPVRNKTDLTAMDLFLTGLAKAIRFYDFYD